ncbi:hypothetical protein ABE321_01895 [Bacillus paralicheniformis]|uniref:hypothetical protein n=1 Tax=Bacillus paralicheniformis TaxID=1648923 RepID=UPI001644A857|nr:hypothetical protein [Bacillus paralicheniformis]
MAVVAAELAYVHLWQAQPKTAVGNGMTPENELIRLYNHLQFLYTFSLGKSRCFSAE